MDEPGRRAGTARALVLGEPNRARQIGACVLGAARVAMLVLQPHAGIDAIGVAAGPLGAASMAVGIVLTKRWGRPAGVSPATFSGWQLTGS
ncbi:EamA/DMT transporter family protein [Nocardia stercoris]|uniref:hypothetical protein n=1 Tax=Nocardia stercoris TaxID=2483361 RepID=UPI0018F3218B|nr:hypothetical protein [Nocardia stercoris]